MNEEATTTKEFIKPKEFIKQKEFLQTFQLSCYKFKNKPKEITKKEELEAWMLANNAYLYFILGGGVSSGKSILQQAIIHQLAVDYPDTKYVIVRKNLTTLKRTSIPTFKKILKFNKEEHLTDYNGSEYSFKYKNKSEVLFLEADVTKDANFDKIYGVEATAALVEEINQVPQKAVNILITRLGRWNNDKYSIPPFLFGNCNPSAGWIKTEFYDKWNENTLKPPYFFMQISPFDNPYNTIEYLTSLDFLPDNEKQRLVYNNWNYSDDPQLLLRYEVLRQQIWEEESEINKNVKYLACDPARFGGDRSVIILGGTNGIYKIATFKGYDNVELAEQIYLMATQEKIKPQNCIVETTGLGGGVFDHLKRVKNFAITSFEGGEKANEKPKDLFSFNFINKRAEAAWLFKKAIEDDEILIPNNLDLLKEASSVRYDITDKAIKLEAKKDIIKRLGYSSDIFDACYMYNYIRVYAKIGTVSQRIVVGKKIVDDIDF